MSDLPNPPEALDPDALRQLRARQRNRSLVTAIILVALCVLFYAITIVKIGAS